MSWRSIQNITKAASINKIQKKLSDGPILWNFELFWGASIMKMTQKMMDGFRKDTICWQMNCLRSTVVGVYACRQLKAGDASQPKGCSALFVLWCAHQFAEVIRKKTHFTDNAPYKLKRRFSCRTVLFRITDWKHRVLHKTRIIYR